MRPVSTDENLKLLYGALKLTHAKPDMKALAEWMDLKSGTAKYRFEILMAKLEKEHGLPAGAEPAKTWAKGEKRKTVEVKDEDSGNNEAVGETVSVNKSKRRGRKKVKVGKSAKGDIQTTIENDGKGDESED